MPDQRFIRWQGLTIAQLSVAVALIYGVSIGGLGFAFSLLQNKEFSPSGVFRWLFSSSLVLFVLATFFSCSVVIARLLDFRLTARKVRNTQDESSNRPLTIFWLDSDAYGRLTWGFFWLTCMLSVMGALALLVSVAATYADRLF